MRKEKTVTDDQIEKAYCIMAGVVRNYGDAYLPIFERLHEEIEKRRAKNDLKNIALQIVYDIDSQYLEIHF